MKTATDSVQGTDTITLSDNSYFKINTGAEVSETTFRQLQTIQLKKPTRNLYDPAMSPLKVTGQFTASLTYKYISCKQTVSVVKDLKQNLLGLS